MGTMNAPPTISQVTIRARVIISSSPYRQMTPPRLPTGTHTTGCCTGTMLLAVADTVAGCRVAVVAAAGHSPASNPPTAIGLVQVPRIEGHSMRTPAPLTDSPRQPAP